MSRQITQPLNQVRLTNVAVVRLQRHGHRFEVACYRNKIINYRQGTETDLSEVLQTERIFTNVSKGQFANSKILQKCFDTTDEEKVCRFILDKGDVQVSDQERAAQLEATLREVASMVSEKCVNPDTRRPYTMAQIRDAMKAAGFMVHPTRNVKQQFLDCVRLLQEKKVLNIERAKMQLALVLDDDGGDVTDFMDRRCNALDLLIEEGVAKSDIQPPSNDPRRIVFQSDPSFYRKVEGIARNSSVNARLEIIQQCVTEEGDVTLGSEMERRAQQQQQQQDAHREEEARNKASVNANDAETEALTNKLQSTTLATKENSPLSDDKQHDSTQATNKVAGNSRKAQKAAQKKSKKAKRREKEEQAEREERLAAEKARQKERAERLGIVEDDNNNTASASGSAEGGGGDTKSCNTCGGAFTSGEYRSHFRSDWHRYNVKLKMSGVAPVSEEEFLLCDSDMFN